MTVIEVTNLRKRYGSTLAVDGVSFAVEPGEIFGILGPNGAGKTTTVECVAGLRTPDEGAIRVLEALELYSAFYPDPADWRVLARELGLTEKLGCILLIAIRPRRRRHGRDGDREALHARQKPGGTTAEGIPPAR
jgi:energy-coupling factor transporter ATP-binding protein EcfA2